MRSRGIIALSPMLVFLVVYLGGSLATGDFYSMPIAVAFMAACIYALAILRRDKDGGSLGELRNRIDIFSHGAGQPNIMLMLWIFLLAGAFAASAKQMGAIDATVQLAMQWLPDRWLLAGLFLAACFISLSIGTSVGTIVALTPIAAGVAEGAELSTAMVVATVVGGAFFGDNLSFISDTTIMATRTQGCRMSDKFRVNFRIVMPAAMGALFIYVLMGADVHTHVDTSEINAIKVLPYVVVLVTALAGIDVMVVLCTGLLLSGIVGICYGSYDIIGWCKAMGGGMLNMSELIIVSMLAGGLMELMQRAGGLDYLICQLTKHVHSRRSAECTIGALAAFTDVCTANNTIAILTVGPLARQMAERFNIDPRRSASLLDTFSCFTQALLPYGAQLLMASGLAGINPLNIIPHLYYPFLMGICTVGSVVLQRTKTTE